ncbi:DUF4329 domain-containing protein [Pseudomonas neuropathica]
MSDVSGRSGGAASSTATFKLPPVSPAFLSEEDAAYWVHTRIPLNPDKEYGSVILLRPDGKFLATSPIPGEATRFDFGTIVPTDARGDMLHPLGYRCIASVHSHPPIHDQFRNGNRRQDENLLRLFMSFYSGGDFIGDVSSRDFFRSAYLSGPDGSLLKYVSSGSPEERDYFLWHQSGAPSGAYDVMALINKLATVGELNVIVSNADWGHSVGRVPADWTAGAAFSTGAVTEMPLMTRVCVNAERAVLAALKSRGAQTAGLILKKLTGEEYVATHARPSGLAAWDAEHLFPRDSQGELQLPRGYRLEGFYFASRPDPKQFPPVQPWLYENFFSPHDMAVAIAAFGRNRHLAKVGRGLSLFMLAQDQAMLKYSFSGTPVEAALSVEYADGTISDNGLQARLSAGTLHPHAFVSMLVLAGKVEVLRGSALWANLGAVDLEWQPFSHFPWPALSRDFLSADDAARHAHEKIGNRRDRQYVGYIFQRDNRFVVTEPLPGDIGTLGQDRLYPQDNNGHAIFPDDHLLHARYVSHVALSRLDPADVDYPKWTFHEALLSLQMFSVDEIRQVLLDQVVLYTSAVPDSLLRYESNGSSSAQSLGRRLGTRHNPGALATELAAGSKRPQDFIREQAAGGRLTSLLDNQLWGYRGRIAPTWSVREAPPDPDAPVWQVIHEFPRHMTELVVSPLPGHTRPAKDLPALALLLPLPWRRPATVAYGAVFASADEVAQSQHAHDRHWQEERSACFGFILKHRERDEYIATERVPVSAAQSNLFELDSLFALQRTSPWYRFPDGFDLHASWYSHHHVEGPVKSPDDWLAHYFISPDNLTTAMYYGRRRPVIASSPAAFYLATRDGALLKYARSQASKLFHDDTSQTTLDSIKRGLASGEWLPTDFVHTVAESGELSVLRTSACWDRSGMVRPTWQPYANLQRRWLGPVFQSADDAAAFARSSLPLVTDKPFGGVILKRPDGLYVASAPIEVSREDFDITEIFPDESKGVGVFPAGCSITARYRSRVARELSVIFSRIEKQIYLNMLSVDTVYSSFKRLPRRAWDEYLFGPDGSLIRYQPGIWDRLRADLLAALTDYKTLPASLDGDAIKQNIRSARLKPSEWVDALAKAGYLQVVIGSEIWGLPRQISRWVPFFADLQPLMDYTRAASAPLCSPVFVQADAVARYVHEVSVSRDTQTFGFILRSRDGLFLASLPVDVQRSGLAVDRVFEQARLPSGFEQDSIYLRAALPPLGARPDDMRNVFVLPNDVQQACRQASTPQGYRPIYISCADDALLKLQLHAFEPGVFYDAFGQVELRPNAFVSREQAAIDERDIASGRFRFTDYVHRMAKAGRLDVIETSDYWSRQGQVDEHWQPRMADTSNEQRWRDSPVPALGPIFHHPDDAARYAQQRTDDSGHSETGYEGAILARSTSSRFVPLEPIVWSAHAEDPVLRIFRSSSDPTISWRNPAARYPNGYTLVASHQFHLSGNTTLAPDTDDVRANFASPARVHAHTHELKNQGFDIQDYYYSTPNHVLIRYTPVYSQAERDLLLARPVDFEAGRWVSRLSPGEFVSQLMELGEFRVLLAGHYWRQTGRMGADWRVRRQQPVTEGGARVRDEL